jgi:hypothetical protein
MSKSGGGRVLDVGGVAGKMPLGINVIAAFAEKPP